MKTDINRREFLKGSAWMLAAAESAGYTCLTEGCGIGGSMHGFACAPLKNVRVGIIGLGMRSSMCIDRLAIIPGVEITMLCDLNPERTAAAQAKLRALGKRPAEEVNDPEGRKRVCDSDRVDVVYSPSPWALRVPVALRAMRGGQTCLSQGPRGVPYRRLLGTRGDRREDEAPLHAARELLLRRGGDWSVSRWRATDGWAKWSMPSATISTTCATTAIAN